MYYNHIFIMYYNPHILHAWYSQLWVKKCITPYILTMYLCITTMCEMYYNYTWNVLQLCIVYDHILQLYVEVSQLYVEYIPL